MLRFGTRSTTRRRTASTGSVPPQCLKGFNNQTWSIFLYSYLSSSPISVRMGAMGIFVNRSCQRYFRFTDLVAVILCRCSGVNLLSLLSKIIT